MTPRSTVLAACVVGLLACAPAAAQRASQTPGVSNPEAWRALEERQYGVAADLFETAIRRTPRDATLPFGAGVAHLMQGHNAEARRWFDAALALNPRLTEAAVLKGQAHYRDGQVDDAIKTYEDALRYAPDDADLLKPLEQWRFEVATQGQFYQAQGAHFTVLFEGPADDAAAQRALLVLEEAYWRIGRELTTYPQRPITVVLYTAEQFQDVTRSPEWAAGVYDGRIKVPMGGSIPSTDDLRRVLEHELVHAMVAAIAGPTVPAWLNEGLATALEPGGVEWAHRQLQSTPERVPFRRLAGGFRGLSTAQARAGYAQSALAVKSLLDQHGATGVAGLLGAIGRGVPFAEAFHQTIATPLDDFLKRAGDE